jgi:hypothetical protein
MWVSSLEWIRAGSKDVEGRIRRGPAVAHMCVKWRIGGGKYENQEKNTKNSGSGE